MVVNLNMTLEVINHPVTDCWETYWGLLHHAAMVNVTFVKVAL